MFKSELKIRFNKLTDGTFYLRSTENTEAFDARLIADAGAIPQTPAIIGGVVVTAENLEKARLISREMFGTDWNELSKKSPLSGIFLKA